MSLRVYGNRPLKTLPGQATRPTPARVREALFNIWQGAIPGCRWLDLCSGIGAMGAEALGREAAEVVGIEQSAKACTVITENWQRIAQSGQRFRLLRGDVVQKLPTLKGQSFDRIYFDPPYASELYLPVLQIIGRDHLLAPDGELAVEHEPKRWSKEAWAELLAQVMPLAVCREKVYGNTAVTFFALDSP
ncbi:MULTISPECIES: 16S rRNA (guanine(966)-N(2))-methyltransferase RsmD [unclassified Leptolyngbya]|uniref:16S rRNA (guanine(966)-N(2))-methyltransferase RsmD n=1 Tax=unclassified Leptolyngbya TaxID=2650499 RepID=UPI001682A19A|nr:MULTISPECIES: 16S rRNA (guanine(966)-N(2))-methyltransferase RsmD [unclassified Leptolyngbya]MBD1911937.1 16S rRNA (guanine(966)-N(2))-methyltransferase RsmD [Leptolyngbya sp. FACHB-8]MBD2154237.1 16S rRNA (guanine(966)-N(2))-methyltransferase RsmD [Leptolyngbya sp. FACHB-16]